MSDTPGDMAAKLEATSKSVRVLRDYKPTNLGGESVADLLRAAASLLRELGERTKWHPIETAPKDGTAVLVWVRGEQAVARWMTDPLGRCWGISTPPHKDNPDRSRSYSNIGPRNWEDMVVDAGPSHWRPLPAPPVEGK